MYYNMQVQPMLCVHCRRLSIELHLHDGGNAVKGLAYLSTRRRAALENEWM